MTSDEGALLWCLRGHGRDVRCVHRRTSAGLELRILWGDELFLTESFRDPACLAKRADEFKATLRTRGWAAMEDCARQEAESSACEDRPAAPGAADRAGADRPGDEGRGRRVLVVDHDPEVRTFIGRYLEEGGYTVTEASDVDGALNALDQQRVDAVVLDVHLPDPMGWGRTGLEVLAFIRLQDASSRLPVLVLTGHSLEPEEQELIRRHRADFFTKPDGYLVLLQRLDQLIGGQTAGR